MVISIERKIVNIVVGWRVWAILDMIPRKSLSEKVTSSKGLKDGKESIINIDEPMEGIEDRETIAKML